MLRVVLLAVAVLLGAFASKELLMALVAKCVVEHGAWVTAFDLQSYPTKGNGVFASRDMKSGEIVIELPFSLHLNQDFAAQFVPRLSSDVDPQILIAIYIAMERFHKLPRVAKSWWERVWPWARKVSACVKESFILFAFF
jgi:hypothetical protein